MAPTMRQRAHTTPVMALNTVYCNTLIISPLLLHFTIIIPTDLEHGAKAEQSPGAGVDGVDILDDVKAGDDQGEPQLDDAEVNHHRPQGDPAQGGEPGPLPAHSQSLTTNLIYLQCSMLNQ